MFQDVPHTSVCDVRKGLLPVSNCTATSFKFQFQVECMYVRMYVIETFNYIHTYIHSVTLRKHRGGGCCSIVKLMYRLLWKPRCRKRACQWLLLPFAISCVCCLYKRTYSLVIIIMEVCVYVYLEGTPRKCNAVVANCFHLCWTANCDMLNNSQQVQHMTTQRRESNGWPSQLHVYSTMMYVYECLQSTGHGHLYKLKMPEGLGMEWT